MRLWNRLPNQRTFPIKGTLDWRTPFPSPNLSILDKEIGANLWEKEQLSSNLFANAPSSTDNDSNHGSIFSCSMRKGTSPMILHLQSRLFHGNGEDTEERSVFVYDSLLWLFPWPVGIVSHFEVSWQQTQSFPTNTYADGVLTLIWEGIPQRQTSSSRWNVHWSMCIWDWLQEGTLPLQMSEGQVDKMPFFLGQHSRTTPSSGTTVGLFPPELTTSIQWHAKRVKMSSQFVKSMMKRTVLTESYSMG